MRIRHFIPLALIAVAVSVFLAFDSTQTSSARDASQLPSEPIAAGDLEEFRGQLATLYADLAEVYPIVIDAGGPRETLERIMAAEQLVAELTTEDLGVLRDAISQYPAWWDLPTTVLLSSVEPEAQGREALGSSASLTSHTCPAAADAVAELAALVLVQLADAAALVTESVMELLPTDGVTIAARAVATGLWIAAKVLVLTTGLAHLVFTEQNAANDECEHAAHQELLHDVVAPEVLIDRINLQVIALPGPREFLVTADEDGLPVDVEFIAVQYSRGDDPISFVDVLANTAVTMIRPGLHHVVISASRGSPVIDPPPNIAEFQVKHDHGSYADFGITVFHQVHDDNVGAGH